MVQRDDEEFPTIAARFAPVPGARAVVVISVERIADSCGYSVPLMEYQGDRDRLVRWAETKGEEGLAAFRAERNTVSLDGLPGIAAAGAGFDPEE